MLKTLCKNGVYIVEGAAKEAGELEKLVAKFGFFRRDHYGYHFETLIYIELTFIDITHFFQRGVQR